MEKLSDTQLNKIFRFPNILSRNIIERKQIGRIVYELSSGNGILGTEIYGVSVRDTQGKITQFNSNLYYNRKDADDYINVLKLQVLLEPVDTV